LNTISLKTQNGAACFAILVLKDTTEPTFNSGSEPCSESKQRWPGKRYSLSGRNRQVERLECWNEDFGSDFKQLQFQRGWHSLSILYSPWKHDYR